MLFKINIEKYFYFKIFKILGGENILDTQLLGNIKFLMSYFYLLGQLIIDFNFQSWYLLSSIRKTLKAPKIGKIVKKKFAFIITIEKKMIMVKLT